jgi:ABC-type antimicrobial peptide transport system permease subunit
MNFTVYKKENKMSNTIYVNKLIKNEISNMKNIRKEIVSNLAKNLYDSKDKVSIIKALDILSKNIEVFKNNSEHEKIIKILSGLPLLYLVIKTISFSKI